MSKLILVTLLLFSSVIFGATQFNWLVFKAKQIKCFFDKKDFIQSECRLKPTRDGHGNLTIWVTNRYAFYDLWLEATVYYKFTRWQPFFTSIDIDVCELYSGIVGKMFLIFLTRTL